MNWFGPQHIDIPPPPEPMWSSTTEIGQARGTLTFLGDGTVIVGCPDGTSDAERAEIAAQVTTWSNSGRKTALVLPWPVDVSDLRPWMQSGDES